MNFVRQYQVSEVYNGKLSTTWVSTQPFQTFLLKGADSSYLAASARQIL